MATKDELYSWIDNAWYKYEEYRKTADSCDEKINRLQPVYRELGELKSSFRRERKSTEEIFDKEGKWRGDKHEKFRDRGEELDSSYGDYYKKLDAAQDAVNVKIGELKAEKAKMIPIINRIYAQIVEWKVEIQNAGN